MGKDSRVNHMERARERCFRLLGEGNTVSVMFCGVGGQGIILASTVLARAAQLGGFDVKVSEVHGMAQRGGSVVGSVRLGRKVFSPTIDEADLIVALEKLEAARHMGKLVRGGFLLVNDYEIVPVSMYAKKEEYPRNILSDISKITPSYKAIEAGKIAAKLGQPRVLNTVLLGFLSNFLPIDKKCWISSIKQTIPSSSVGINIQAFERGLKY
ncbi:MAG: indolepyruvate oxidoreductase subunit beta [Actinomycetota bacterium]